MPGNVLIVDDESKFLKSLTEGLSTYASHFNVITASDGIQALKVLRSKPVELVVTDLKMPRMDGFELMSHMSTEHPLVPVIVISAFAGSATEEEVKHAGALTILEKPLGLDELSGTILATLSDEKKARGVAGLGLHSFLQLIEMEGKSCVLAVAVPKKGKGKDKGYFIFKDGKLLDAIYNKQQGKEAALAMLAFEHVTVTIRNLPKKKIKNRIKCGVMPILMEDARRKDERVEIEDDTNGPNSKQPLDVLDGPQKPVENESKERVAAAVQTISFTEEKNKMALENILNELKGVNGVKAVGIMNFTGEMLALESNDADVQLDMVGATFNDIFRQAHEACGKVGLKACQETVINTPDGAIVMRCSGVDAAAHIHLIGILAGDGNQALFKMQAAKLLPAAMEEVA